MCDFCAELMDELMERFRGFNMAEVGVFKTCLVLMGVLIGMYAGACGRKWRPFIWIGFLASYAYVMYRLFVNPYGCPICDCCEDWDDLDDEADDM